MTRKRRKTRPRQQRLAVTLRNSLGTFRAQHGRLVQRLERDLLLYGSSFVKAFSDGRAARVAPLTEEEFHETAQAWRLERHYTGAGISGKWWFEK